MTNIQSLESLAERLHGESFPELLQRDVGLELVQVAGLLEFLDLFTIEHGLACIDLHESVGDLPDGFCLLLRALIPKSIQPPNFRQCLIYFVFICLALIKFLVSYLVHDEIRPLGLL